TLYIEHQRVETSDVLSPQPLNNSTLNLWFPLFRCPLSFAQLPRRSPLPARHYRACRSPHSLHSAFPLNSSTPPHLNFPISAFRFQLSALPSTSSIHRLI